MRKKRIILKKIFKRTFRTRKLIKYKKHKYKKHKIKFIFILFILLLLIYNNIFHIRKKEKINVDGRIFLCTIYNNEAEYAYIHIWRLYDYIYKFIIVVSNMTFSGHPKNITFEPLEDKIKLYKDKIDLAYFDNVCNKEEFPSEDPNWCREYSQRDFALKYIEKHYNPTEKDLLIVVDIDEILTREGIQYLMKNPPKDFYGIKGSMYFPYYYHRLEDWDRGFVIRYNKNITSLSKHRGNPGEGTLRYKDNPSKPLITHCSYCFKNMEAYKNKLKSFSHQEYNTQLRTSNNWIFRTHYCREKINSPIVKNDEPYEGWKHLIPDDPRLKFLVDRSFMFPLNKTSYTEKDLDNMCYIKYNRTPFEPSAKYNNDI